MTKVVFEDLSYMGNPSIKGQITVDDLRRYGACNKAIPDYIIGDFSA